MTISATLTIQNQTDLAMTGLSAPNPKDGSFSSKPAPTIPARSSTSFDVKQNNSLSPGPEGTVTYDMTNGNASWKVQIYWNYSSGAGHSQTYNTTISPATPGVSGPATSITDNSGDHHAVSYFVNYTPQAPQDWDMVWALSVGEINAQLSTLAFMGLIPSQFTQPLNPHAAAGSDDAWPQLIVKSMQSPTVLVPDNSTSHLELHFVMKTATLQYLEGASHQSLDLSGDTVIVTLNLSQQTVTDAATLSIDTTAKQKIQKLQALNFGVYRVFADLQNPALFSSLKVIKTSDNSAVTLSSSAQNALKATLSGIGQLNLSIQATGTKSIPATTPLLIPTQYVLSSTQYPNDYRFSSLNLCMMTRYRNQPALTSRLQFTAPMVPTDSTKARLLISQDTLGECFLKPVVLPLIVQAADITTSTNIPSLITSKGNPLCYGFSASKNNGGQNGGRGQKVVVNNGFDQYVYATETVSFTTSPNLSADGKQVVISLSGSHTVVAEVNQYPLDTFGIGSADPLGTSTYTQPWTGSITIAASERGQLLTTVAISLGSLQTHSNSTLDGYVSNFFDSLLGWTTTSPSQGIQSNVNTFIKNLTSAFAESSQISESIDDYVVLPTGQAYFYANTVFNADGAISIDVSIPG